jgi:hypothetical protein
MNSHPTRINLGCGSDLRPDWINIDASQTYHPDLALNLEHDSLLPHFRANSVHLVLAQDILEHLYRFRALHLCQEIFTLLIPKGLLVTRMPNTRLIIDAPIEFSRKIPYLYGGQDVPQQDDAIKKQVRKSRPDLFAHKFGWDPDTFHMELSKIGFVDIVQVTEWPNFTTKAYKPSTLEKSPNME